jgi:hypothetical protein
MSAQTFEYTKVSQLPAVTDLANSDVFIVNASGHTSKISLTNLIAIINASISQDISSLTTRVTTLEGTTSSLAGTVSDNSQTINNIITAGFNLIGVDVPEP